MKYALDLTGKSFNRWTVIRRAANRLQKNHSEPYWLCRCSCGTEKEVRGHNLRHSYSRSCGCLIVEAVLRTKVTHGESATGRRSAEYTVWHGMKARCLNPKSQFYVRYGGRGITICKRWMSYENFLHDMGRRPTGFTLERKNNDGDYKPSNCRWADRRAQANNRRSNRLLLLSDGSKETFATVQRRLGVTEKTLRYYIKKLGSDAAAIKRLKHYDGRPKITHCPRGHEYTTENTRLYDGRRFCIACDRSRGKLRSKRGQLAAQLHRKNEQVPTGVRDA